MQSATPLVLVVFVSSLTFSSGLEACWKRTLTANHTVMSQSESGRLSTKLIMCQFLPIGCIIVFSKVLVTAMGLCWFYLLTELKRTMGMCTLFFCANVKNPIYIGYPFKLSTSGFWRQRDV